jgi:V8-like Glu-specific endopeptidase
MPEGPIPTARVRRRKPIEAKIDPPPEAANLIHTTFFSFENAEPSARSTVRQVSARGRRVAWQLDVEVSASAIPVPQLAPPAVERVIKRNEIAELRGIRPESPARPAFANQRFFPSRIPAPRRQHVVTRDGKRLDPLEVFLPDTRFVYQDSSYPWRAAGRVTSSGRSGSGVLVGPRHVLTASHVVNWSSPNATFIANQFDNTNNGMTFATLIWRYEPIGSVNTGNVDEDYAVLVLERPLGGTLGWMGSRTYNDDWDNEPYWANVGYPASLGGGDRPVYHDDIMMFEVDGGSMKAMNSITADLTPGHSGGPVFGWWDAEPYVVGVVSAQGLGANWISGGSAMVNLVKTARLLTP